MRVEDALRIGELSKGNVIAGTDGASREILSIEVMEVPEVVTWISKGILVMTAFYSIREEPEKQIEVVKTLIEKEAAGIVVKIGRFVHNLPDAMIALANEHSFPIIAIPKDISYINVLTPLYERLYEEKLAEVDKSKNPFLEFERTDFPTVSHAVEYLSQLVDSPIYIEDFEGRLLYTSNEFYADKWRKTNLLFSKPNYSLYTQTLEAWRVEFHNTSHTHLELDGQRNQFILPLISKKNVYAVVHLLYKDKEKFKSIAPTYLKEVGHKLSEIILNEQLQLQKSRMQDIDFLEDLKEKLENQKIQNRAVILHFKSNQSDTSLYSAMSLLDYSCLYRKKLTNIVEQLTDYRTVIFEKYHHYFALLLCGDDSYQIILKKWNKLINEYNREFPGDDFRVSISQPFENSIMLDDKILSVKKTMDIGLKMRPEEFVYSRDKLGIYEILFNLTSDSSVLQFINDVLSDLLQADEELYKSLQVYLNENGNVSQASKKLYIHRRTMTYRLQKIQELLTMNLDNAEHRFILQFCIKIKESS